METKDTNVENRENTFLKDGSEEYTKIKKRKEKYVFAHDDTGLFRFRIVACIVLLGVFLYFLLISLEVVRYSGSYYIQGILGMVVSAVVIVANIFFIRSAIKELNFCKRYDLYMDLLKNRQVVGITELEKYSRQDKGKIIKDLNLAIKQKLIPQGHFNDGDDIFMLTDEKYNEYKMNPGIYDYYNW